MKKVVVLVLALIVTAAAGAYIYYYRPFAPIKSPESVLPQETLMMIRFDRLAENIQAFRQSRLGNTLENLNPDAILNALGADPHRIDTVKNQRNEFIAALDSNWFKTLFSESAALAMLPADIESFRPDNPDALAESIVLVSRTRHPAGLVSSLSRMFATDLDIRTERHGGWEISRFDREANAPVYVATAGKMIFMALAPEPVSACLDVDAGRRGALTAHPDYQMLKTDLFDAPHMQVAAYCNGAATLKFFIDTSRALGAAPEEIKAVQQHLGGIKAAGFAAYDDHSDLLHKKFTILLDKKTIGPIMSQLLAADPETNDTLDLMPEDPLLVTWQNMYTLKNYWELSRVDGNLSEEETARLQSSVESTLGIGFDDLLGAFGNQFGFVLNDVATNGFFPIPELAFIGQVIQQPVVDRLAAAVTESAGLTLLEENYQGTPIHYAVIPFAVGVAPAYTCEDGFCILATRRELIKTMLSGLDKPPRIKGNSAFMAVDRGLTEENNQMVYIRFASLVAKLREVITWSQTFAALADPSGARASQDIITHLVNPLLDGLEMYETVGLRVLSLNNGNKVRADVWISVDRTAPDPSL